MKPPRIQKGQIIGVVAPSAPLTEKKKGYLENFKNYMESKGFKVVYGKHIFEKGKYGVCAGNPEQRAEDINAFFADPEVHIIWCLQGGEPAIQVLPHLDYDVIKKNPKPVIGKSNIDVLLLALFHKTGLIGFHGPDTKVGNPERPEMDGAFTKEWFVRRLMKGEKEIVPSTEWETIRGGIAEGTLLGCNNESIRQLIDTEYSPSYKGAVLFYEQYCGNPAVLISYLAQFEALGVFEDIKGIVIGHNYAFEGGFLPEEIIRDYTEKWNLPILKIGEFGHYQPHAFLPIGARVKVDATERNISILEDFIS